MVADVGVGPRIYVAAALVVNVVFYHGIIRAGPAGAESETCNIYQLFFFFMRIPTCRFSGKSDLIWAVVVDLSLHNAGICSIFVCVYIYSIFFFWVKVLHILFIVYLQEKNTGTKITKGNHLYLSLLDMFKINI